MLVPKRVKHRKEFRGNMKGRAKGGTEVAFGEYGLQAVEPAWVYQPSNRSSTYCHDSLHQTWR